MALYTAVLIFLLTLALIIWKPRGIHEAFFALPGAGLLYALKLIMPEDIGYIWGFVWNATFSLIGIMLFTSLLDQNGFFRWAALHIVHRFHHKQVRLMVGLSLLAACVTVFFNNDGTILIMIPIVLEVTQLLRLSRRSSLAFLLGVGLMADTASAPLMMSNLTNILTADFFRYSFGEYAAYMLVPGMTAIGATILAVALYFGKGIREEEGRTEAPSSFPEPASVIQNRRLFYVSWVIVAGMMAGYLLSGQWGVPVMVIALSGAGLQLAATAIFGKVDVRRTASGAPWLIIVFALAMNLVVYALHRQGATDWLPGLIEPLTAHGSFTGVVGAGLLFSMLAAVVNNLPAVLIASLAIDQAGAGHSYLPFASLIGTSVGAKLTPIGSLATLLWMQLIRQGGITVTWGEYLKYGLKLTIPIVLCSLIALYVILI